MNDIQVFSVPKDDDPLRPNEDSFKSVRYRRIFAMADGASESYDSRSWGSVLVECFMRDQCISPAWIENAISRYRKTVDYDDLSWSRQAAFDRGSFSTILGVHIAQDDRTAIVTSIGDSLFALSDGTNLVETFAYTSQEQFTQNPLLISSVFEKNISVKRALNDQTTVTSIDLSQIKSPTLMLMTDALGAWLLSSSKARVKKLLQLRSNLQFENLVHKARASGDMVVDDTSLMMVSW
jgi:hypothetical protein